MGFSLFRKKKDTGGELAAPNDSLSNGQLAPLSAKEELEHRKIDAFNSMIEAEREAERNNYDLAMSKIKTTAEVAGMLSSTINNVADVWKTSKIIEQNIAEINSKTTVELARIAADYNKFQASLNHIFSDRHMALNKTYSLLDQALASNDRELIIHSLRAMSDIVTSRPFEDFDKFMDNWDDEDNTDTLELGF